MTQQNVDTYNFSGRIFLLAAQFATAFCYAVAGRAHVAQLAHSGISRESAQSVVICVAAHQIHTRLVEVETSHASCYLQTAPPAPLIHLITTNGRGDKNSIYLGQQMSLTIQDV